MRAFLVVLFLQGVALPAPVALAEARERVDALERLLGRQKSSNEELIAATEAVGVACAELAAETDPKDRGRFLDDAAAALLKALSLERVDGATNRNFRNDVQLAAARAFRHVGAERAKDLMSAIERHILNDRPYAVDPSFYDAILDPLVRLGAEGTFEWVLDQVVNADAPADMRERALAGLDALLELTATGAERRMAVKRLLAIYQLFMYAFEDDSFDAVGFRDTKYINARSPSSGGLFLLAGGPYWEAMRPTVMRVLRELTIDPRTGVPAFDLDTKEEMATLGRYKVWYARNKTTGQAPWIDAAREPRVRSAPPYTRAAPASWRVVGIPWADAWRTNRMILDRPLAPAAWRDELRTKILPALATTALGDEAWHVRAAAAVTLGRVAAPDAAALLRQRIEREPVEEVREAALLGLLLLADAGQRDFLRLRATDPGENPRLRAYALLALGILKDAEALRPALETKGDLGACAVRAMGLAGAPPAEIVAILADRRRGAILRGEAGTALLDLKDPGVLPQVLAVLKEPSRGTPVAAAAAAIAAGLAPSDNEKTMRRLAREMGDAEERFVGVRVLLASSMARTGGGPGAQALVEEYRNLRPNSLRVAERGHFLLALGRAGAKELLTAELESLDHDSDRAACALGLALAGERTAVPRLRAMLAARTDTYAPHGMMALALLDDHGGSAAVRDILRRRRGDAILAEGALALAMLDGGKALPDLLALWERAHRAESYDALAWAFRLAATADAVAPLRAIVEGKGDPTARAFALMALGRMADPAAPLHRLARDSNPYGLSPTLLDLARWRDAAPLLD